MKCENCGKNEVTFIYQSNINGRVTENHLCSECAGKLGYADKIAARSRSIMEDFFGGSLFGGSVFDDFFSPRRSLLGRMIEDPFDDFFSDMPVLSTSVAETTEPEKKQEALVDQTEQNRFSRMRQINALRMEMKKAVWEENFERAAELRDEIRKLEDFKESA